MIKRSLLFVAMLLCITFSVQAQEVTTADGNGADTYLSNDTQTREGYDFTADGTHGGEPSIKMRNLEGVRMKLGYVRFDISQLSDVQNISLALNVVWFKGVDSRFDIYALVNESLDDWDEMTISYNTAPGFVPTTQGIPIGYYDITEDLVKVAEMAYPDDSLGYIYSTPNPAMDNFINNDTNGLVTFALIPDPVPDADWDVRSKEDSVIYAPKLVVLESITTADGNGADTYLSNDNQPREGYDFTADATHGGEVAIKMRNLEGVRMKLGYLRFDISQLSDAQSVSLAFNVVWFKGVNSTFHIYALVNESLDDWDELTTSYNTAPGFVPTTQGIPIGYYDITEDLVKVAEMAYPDDFLGYVYSTPSAQMDSVINSDTNGLVTFAIIPDPVPDGDWDVSSKEDSVIYAPKLVFEECVSSFGTLEIPTAITSANSGESQTVTATVTDNVGIQSATLYYRKGGASSFTSTAMNNTSGNNWEGTIPASFITERGTEYYISVSDVSGNTATYPESDPQNSPQVIQVNFSNLSFTTSTPAMAYQMISVPAYLDSTSPSSVLKDDLGNYDDTQWRLLQYEKDADGDYNEFPNVSNFEPGKGFWLITRESKSLDTGAGKSVTTAQNYQITLQPGWNQIGNPYAFTVNWSDVIKDNNVGSQLVGYSGTSNDESGYEYNRTQLVPFEGYFVKNQSTSATTIQIPPKSATGTSSIAKHATGIPGIENLQGNEWMVRIKAKSGRYVDKDNYIGVLNDASDEWDNNDFSEAPFFEDLVSLYFPHLDWQSYPGLYTGDFRSVTSEGYYWDFNVKTNSSDSEVTLILTQVQNLPPGWEIILLDRVTHTSLNFLELEKYTYIPGENEIERKFRIVVGRAEFIKANDLDLAGVLQDFSLSQNYPNPFNSETRLNYELPKVSDVNIAVFNLNGQLVKTLFAGLRSAGRYVVSWDGKTQDGSRAVSGVYLARMKAGNFMDVKKILLVQ